ncbi:hypothetical protein V6N13_012862 [Hibiscus sabdariffa]
MRGPHEALGRFGLQHWNKPVTKQTESGTDKSRTGSDRFKRGLIIWGEKSGGSVGEDRGMGRAWVMMMKAW